MREINERIERLLHDAEHAQSGSNFASMIGHLEPAARLKEKALCLQAEAENIYLQNPGAAWPECDFPKPKRRAKRADVVKQGDV